MATLLELDKKTKEYSDARSSLVAIVQEINDEIDSIKRRKMISIKAAVAKSKEKKAVLEEAISDSKDCFVKPRTIILHGIKIGFLKGRGKIELDDPDQVVKLIKKHFPEQAEVLIKTTEVPIKDLLNSMSAADLKKLGISVQDSDDQIVIKAVDSNVDKLVNALLKENGDSEDCKE